MITYTIEGRSSDRDPWLTIGRYASLDRAEQQLIRWEAYGRFEYRLVQRGGDNATTWGNSGCGSAFDASAGASSPPPF